MTTNSSPSHDPTWGIVCALPAELGGLRERCVGSVRRAGQEILELELDGVRALACSGGVGKVASARAATLLIGEGATAGLLVVGTCGGLRQGLRPGTLVHCTRAVQTDFSRREGREVDSDAALRRAWREIAQGEEGWFLTADRPVLSLWQRLRLARAFAGPCVADMETAAVASVAAAAGVRWAALRAVTDRATPFGALAFHMNFGSQAGRAADTVPHLLARIGHSR